MSVLLNKQFESLGWIKVTQERSLWRVIETSSSVKEDIFEKLSDYQLPKKDSASFSLFDVLFLFKVVTVSVFTF
jgi:hypothetical protein